MFFPCWPFSYLSIPEDNATCSRGLCTVLYWTPKWHLSCIFYKWLFLGGVQRTFPAVSVKSEQGMEFRLIIHYGSSPTRRWTGMRRSLHHFDGYWEDHWLTADRTHGTRAAVDRLTFELVFSGPALHTWRPGAKRQREGARRLGQWVGIRCAVLDATGNRIQNLQKNGIRKFIATSNIKASCKHGLEIAEPSTAMDFLSSDDYRNLLHGFGCQRAQRQWLTASRVNSCCLELSATPYMMSRNKVTAKEQSRNTIA
ncbi:uncharacterized protein [Dermacentor albipictus]|uniref:uncharacterized protein isoform X2 n=1 Tax=Dermacentor albipictus TaxID=60249 RepID=UPI0038FCE03C